MCLPITEHIYQSILAGVNAQTFTFTPVHTHSTVPTPIQISSFNPDLPLTSTLREGSKNLKVHFHLVFKLCLVCLAWIINIFGWDERIKSSSLLILIKKTRYVPKTKHYYFFSFAVMWGIEGGRNQSVKLFIFIWLIGLPYVIYIYIYIYKYNVNLEYLILVWAFSQNIKLTNGYQ